MVEGAVAAGAFCSSAEELGLLGEMLKSDSKGASVAATFLQGYALQVCHVRHLMAILNSSDDVHKLKACLQEAETHRHLPRLNFPLSTYK